MPSDMPTLVGCYFYVWLDWEQPFDNLEADIASFKVKGQVIVWIPIQEAYNMKCTNL